MTNNIRNVTIHILCFFKTYNKDESSYTLQIKFKMFKSFMSSLKYINVKCLLSDYILLSK